MRDDLGTPYDGPRPASRVVSLSPAITEALASIHPERIVGATDLCTQPRDLARYEIAQVQRGRRPDLPAIAALRPDVVVTSRDETRPVDVQLLRAVGVRVWVTDVRSLRAAADSVERLLRALHWRVPEWLAVSRVRWSGPLPPESRTVALPVARDPWRVVGSDTFANDLLRRLGWRNVFAHHDFRYPRVTIEEIEAARPDVVLLPDGPCGFSTTNGPEAFQARTSLVSWRLLTWFGPSVLEASELV